MKLISIVLPFGFVTDKGFKLWMQVRKEDGPLNGMLEFPGGKIEEGETPEIAGKREFLEEVEVELPSLEPFKILKWDYSDRELLLYAHISFFEDLKSPLGEWFDIDFETKSEPYKNRIPEVNHIFIDDLCYFLKKQINGNALEDLCRTF